MAVARSTLVERCGSCKSPTKDKSRSLCTMCLNQNLQKACESAVRPNRPLGVMRRASFPGMPRAVLGPVSSEKGRLTPSPGHGHRAIFPRLQQAVIGQELSPPCRANPDGFTTIASARIAKPSLDVEVEAALRCLNLNESKIAQSRSVDGRNGDGRSHNVESTDEEVSLGRDLEAGEQESDASVMDSSLDKLHLFRIEKNLTVRIPNCPLSVPSRPGNCQPVVVPSEQANQSLPPHKEVRFSQPSNFKKSSIRVNANAEAELMTRLLADCMPIIKSAAPLVLPPCKVAPISPPSPSQDPLWKRRYVPCPKMLKVQTASVC